MPLYSVKVETTAEIWQVVRADDGAKAEAKAIAMSRHPQQRGDWLIDMSKVRLAAIKYEEA